MKLGIGRLPSILTAAVLVAGTLVTTAQPALATQTQICGNNGTGYCMNDWNGGLNNNPVKMYYGGSSNENFFTYRIDPCNSSPPDRVTETCPFTLGSGYNAALAGHIIFEVGYGTTPYCIGTTGVQAGGPTAILTGCPGVNGSGGGNGTIWVQWNTGIAITRYWADTFYQNAGESCCAAAPFVVSGGNPGQPLYMADQGFQTVWGGPGWQPGS